MELYLEKIFLDVINMSITSSYVILIVLLARKLLKKAPKVFSYGLWSVVFFRLVFPISFSSAFSFLKVFNLGLNKTGYLPNHVSILGQPQLGNGISKVNAVTNNPLPQAAAHVSADPIRSVILILAVIWALGILSLIIYSFISYIRLKQTVSTAILLQGNIFECENITTPFVLGAILPKIYLPAGLGETEQGYIIKHEKTHIKRLDHLLKPACFLVLCLHWFNPLVWLSFILMNRDLEMSCDERVIKELGQDIKQGYSTSLLNVAVRKKMFSGYPLAFGETGAGGRIKNVLNYRRPALWVIVLAGIVVAVTGLGLLSNPDATAGNEMEKYELAETWAEALKLRDGKLRYEIMSDTMREKFIAEQIQRSGQDWNYNIGGSSPWVAAYDIKVDGDEATITYHLADSGGDKYVLTEMLTFGLENKKLVVTAAEEKITEWDRISRYATDAQSAMKAYTEALLEGDYMAILGFTHDAPFDPDGQDIWDTIKIAGVKVISEDVREDKACYELELHIEDGGSSAFAKGISPRWLWLVKGEHGWYAEGLMTGGRPDKNWWASALSSVQLADIILDQLTNQDFFIEEENICSADDETIIGFGKAFVNLFNGAVARQKKVSFEKYIINKNLERFTDEMLLLTQKQDLLGANAINYGLKNEFKSINLQHMGDDLCLLEVQFEFEGSGMGCKMLITTENKALKLADLYFGNKDGVDTYATGHPAEREIKDPDLWESEEWVEGVFDKLIDFAERLGS